MRRSKLISELREHEEKAIHCLKTAVILFVLFSDNSYRQKSNPIHKDAYMGILTTILLPFPGADLIATSPS